MTIIYKNTKLYAMLFLLSLSMTKTSMAKPATETEPDNPIVVELFTSQSCSSCPPADKILNTLSKQPHIIALGFHVSYWNHLHWTDTLSHEFCDMRQHGYAGLKGSHRIYTPQMIINGTKELIGSRKNDVGKALKNAQKTPLSAIKIKHTESGIIKFTLPKTKESTYRLWAFGYKKHHHQSIQRGENVGKSISYTNAVQTYTNLGSWNGQTQERTFEKPQDDIDGIAILAQRNGYGQIIAAGKLEFKP